MSKTATSFVLGYHGCSRDTGLRAIESGLALEQSKKDYDWLGPGVYFWEGDPHRAMEWAEEKVRQKIYRDAFVIGAVIDLGNCLDLLLRENLELLVGRLQKPIENQQAGSPDDAQEPRPQSGEQRRQAASLSRLRCHQTSAFDD